MKKTPESKANRHHTLSRVFEIILFVSLAAASVYSAIRLAGAPESLPAGTEGKTRSDGARCFQFVPKSCAVGGDVTMCVTPSLEPQDITASE